MESDLVLPAVRVSLGVVPFEVIAFHVMDAISEIKTGSPQCLLLLLRRMIVTYFENTVPLRPQRASA
jgi:hypothetical protein